MFAGKKSAQIREILINESAWEEMTCLFAPSLGLEKHPHGRACFRHQLGRCAGACCGKEPVVEHQLRLLDGLQQIRVFNWPYSGAVGLVEQHGDVRQIHVINNWYYLGSVEDIADAARLTKVAHGFDRDGYKILSEPLLKGQHKVILLE